MNPEVYMADNVLYAVYFYVDDREEKPVPTDSLATDLVIKKDNKTWVMPILSKISLDDIEHVINYAGELLNTGKGQYSVQEVTCYTTNDTTVTNILGVVAQNKLAKKLEQQLSLREYADVTIDKNIQGETVLDPEESSFGNDFLVISKLRNYALGTNLSLDYLDKLVATAGLLAHANGIPDSEIRDVAALLERKNRAYGDSFAQARKAYTKAKGKDHGDTAIQIRVFDKVSRLENLLLNPTIDSGDESIKDTILDLIGYLVMTKYVVEKEKQNGTK